MARKTLEQRHRGFNTGAFASASVPTTCPVCGETPAVAKGEKRHQVLAAHLIDEHRPDATCQRAHRSDAAPIWRLDWEGVVHQQPELFSPTFRTALVIFTHIGRHQAAWRAAHGGEASADVRR
jgi:hypothetical protein